MIASCPACAKRYRIADDAVPAAGRNVRCAACGHGWSVTADDVPDDAAEAAAVPVAVAPAAPVPVAPLVRAPPRRRLGWLAAVFALLAVAAVGAVEFAPENTFDPPRLGLPPPHLPVADLASLRLPSLPELPDVPPLDLTQIPLVGEALDRLVYPPASPLRVTARSERQRLTSGASLLTITGMVTNPTAAPVPLAGIDAALLDPAGHIALRWRIAAPASVIGAHGSAAFETTAANFPAGATVLRLRPR